MSDAVHCPHQHCCFFLVWLVCLNGHEKKVATKTINLIVTKAGPQPTSSASTAALDPDTEIRKVEDKSPDGEMTEGNRKEEKDKRGGYGQRG